MSMIPDLDILSSAFVRMWSIKVEEPLVTRVGDFISCVKKKFEQNSIYCLLIDEIVVLFLLPVMFLLHSKIVLLL